MSRACGHQQPVAAYTGSVQGFGFFIINLSYDPAVGNSRDLELLTGDTKETSLIRLKFNIVPDPDISCYGLLVGRKRPVRPNRPSQR
jgi:hypothetical protein